MAKPNGKKKKTKYCFDNFKTARAECREKALQTRRYSWPFCWEPQCGYYCPDECDNYRRDALVCFVDKSGAFTYIHKEDAEFHRIKNYTNPSWWQPQPTPAWKKNRIRKD